MNWPANLKMVRSSINAGISASISTTPGSIGYLDYGFANLAGLQMASLQNREGHYIAPGFEGGQAALAITRFPEDMIAWLPDPPGAASYPITSYTWLMFYTKYADAEKAASLRKMVSYLLDNGQKLSSKFGYIPLPAEVVEQVRAASANIQ